MVSEKVDVKSSNAPQSRSIGMAYKDEVVLMDSEAARIELISQMFIAYVLNHKLNPSQVEDVISAINRSMSEPLEGKIVEEQGAPAVSIEQSVQPNFLVCFEDGKHFKSLKAPPHSSRPYTRQLPKALGVASRLSDGGSELL